MICKYSCKKRVKQYKKSNRQGFFLSLYILQFNSIIFAKNMEKEEEKEVLLDSKFSAEENKNKNKINFN